MKLVLLFVGAPLALAAERIGARWLSYVGLALLVVALLIPSRADQELGERLEALVDHLPGFRWFRSRR